MKKKFFVKKWNIQKSFIQNQSAIDVKIERKKNEE